MTISQLPRVTIVTPSYNQGHFIEATIRSILLQEYPNLEYLIMDGGSTDKTVAVLKQYEQQLQWVSETDGGQTDAINKGLQKAQGDIVAYLNSDDLYLPHTLHAVVAYFKQHPTVGLVYGDCQVIDETGQTVGLIKAPTFNVKRMINRGEFIPQPAAFWRKEVIAKVGLFDQTLRYSMDYEFFIRVGQQFSVAYIPQTLACFRLHSLSKTVSQEERHWHETLMVSERYGLKPWTIWYWLRRLRHWGLRALPPTMQYWVKQHLNRPHDPSLRDK